MHGKGGLPDGAVLELALSLAEKKHLVANLEMPWSSRRDYDVDVEAGVKEVQRALEALRAKGASKVFVAGHSQGGLVRTPRRGTRADGRRSGDRARRQR